MSKKYVYINKNFFTFYLFTRPEKRAINIKNQLKNENLVRMRYFCAIVVVFDLVKARNCGNLKDECDTDYFESLGKDKEYRLSIDITDTIGELEKSSSGFVKVSKIDGCKLDYNFVDFELTLENSVVSVQNGLCVSKYTTLDENSKKLITGIDSLLGSNDCFQTNCSSTDIVEFGKVTISRVITLSLQETSDVNMPFPKSFEKYRVVFFKNDLFGIVIFRPEMAFSPGNGAF